jgi:transposase-like protein
VIENKKEDTTIPIIIDKVVEGSIIWTDESKSYSRLGSVGYLHDTVCHKYEFVNTQAVESFNNELNLERKRRKGIATDKRPELFEEFVWKFNNGERRFLRIWELLKIKH